MRGHCVLATVCVAPPPDTGTQSSLEFYVLKRETPYRGWER